VSFDETPTVQKMFTVTAAALSEINDKLTADAERARA
jgi:hypothetical protein